MLALLKVIILAGLLQQTQGGQPGDPPARDNPAVKTATPSQDSTSLRNQTPAKNFNEPIEIPLTEQAPTIDGQFQDGEWAQARVFEGPYIQFDPHFGEKTKESTAAWLMHDQENLYVAFEAFQDPVTFVEKKATRDKAYDQDQIGILIDPLGNRQEVYYFFFGVSGALGDIRAVRSISSGDFEDPTWDGDLRYQVRKTGTGYVAEAAIPFANFRRSGKSEVAWNLNFFRRVEGRKEKSLFYPAPNMTNEALFESLKPVVLRGIAAMREPVEIRPYGIYGRDLSRTGEKNGDAGMDARIPVGTRSVANVAFNPDFSQLEGDPLQFDFNHRYALYYQEYRPFFIEEGGVFSNPSEIYYSRAVVNPFLAGRYTYKDEKNQAGVIAASDEQDTLIGNDDATAAILRYKRQIGQSLAGLMALSRHDRQARSDNLVLEADGMVHLPLRVRLDFNLAGTTFADTLGRDGNERRGYYYRLFPQFSTNDWTLVGNILGFSPKFTNELGYVTRVDQSYVGGYLGRTFHFKSKALQKIEVGEDFGTTSRWGRWPDNAAQNRDSMEYFFSHQLNLTLFTGTSLSLSFHQNRDYWNGVFLDYRWSGYYLSSRINKYLAVDNTGLFGTNVDYDHVRVGKKFEEVANVYVTPVPTLTLNAGALIYNFYADTNRQAQRPSEVGTARLQWRSYSHDWGITWSPSTLLSMRLVGERTVARFVPGFYAPEEVLSQQDRLFGILEYRPSKGNVIYLGGRWSKKNATPMREQEKLELLFFKFSHNFTV